jgi:hypothetical protein
MPADDRNRAAITVVHILLAHPFPRDLKIVITCSPLWLVVDDEIDATLVLAASAGVSGGAVCVIG